MPRQNSITSMPRWTSPRASASVAVLTRQQLGQLVDGVVDQFDKPHHAGARRWGPCGPARTGSTAEGTAASMSDLPAIGTARLDLAVLESIGRARGLARRCVVRR